MDTIIATSPEDIAQMEQRIKELELQSEGRLTTLIKASTLIELYKKDEQRLKLAYENEMQEVLISHAFIDKFLEELESEFDVEGKLKSPEIAVDYLAAATHRKNQGRINNRIKEVQAWIDPVEDTSNTLYDNMNKVKI